MAYKERLQEVNNYKIARTTKLILNKHFTHPLHGDTVRVTERDISAARQAIYAMTDKVTPLLIDDVLAFFAGHSCLRQARRNDNQFEILVNVDDWERIGKIADEHGIIFPNTPATEKMNKEYLRRRNITIESLEAFASADCSFDPTHKTLGILFFDFYRAFQYFCVLEGRKHASIEETREAYEHCRRFAGYPENQQKRLDGVSVGIYLI